MLDQQALLRLQLPFLVMLVHCLHYLMLLVVLGMQHLQSKTIGLCRIVMYMIEVTSLSGLEFGGKQIMKDENATKKIQPAII